MKPKDADTVVTVVGLRLHPEAPPIDFHLNHGQALSFTGSNGTGKSRLLAALIGQADCGGVISIKNFDVNNASSRKRALEKVGVLFQESGLLRDLNVENNISLPSKVRGLPVGESALKETEILLALADCTLSRNSYVSELSDGESKRIALIRSLSGGSEILFLDEPVSGLSTDRRETILELLVTLRQEEVISALIVFTDDEAVASRLTDTQISLSRNGEVFGIPSPRTQFVSENTFST